MLFKKSPAVPDAIKNLWLTKEGGKIGLEQAKKSVKFVEGYQGQRRINKRDESVFCSLSGYNFGQTIGRSSPTVIDKSPKGF